MKPTAQAVGHSGMKASRTGTKDLFSNVNILIMLTVALLFSASCNRRATDAIFPTSNEVAGWVRTGDIRTFNAADLWKYIDGEAERYLKAGVQRVFTADYKFQNTVDVVVDIYAMGSAEGARTIFDSEPTGDARSVQLGEGARLYSQSLIFRKGLYLVRIVTFQESSETSQAMVELGRNIERRLTR
ncbi:MAG TPA: DUF6599 family protein [Terriglobales bacterium]|nr:DUF6599 family protein [Terriglobales bacterium]